MLCPFEIDLAQRLSGLPGAPVLLDTAEFGNRIQAFLPEARIAQVRRRYVRLKPDENLLILFEATVNGRSVLFYGKAYRASDRRKLQKTLQREAAETSLGAGRLCWPDDALEACIFPNDNKLPELPRLFDDAERRGLVRRILPAETKLHRAAVSVLAYKPERRWVAKLERKKGPSAVLKAYSEETFDAARRGWNGVTSNGFLRIPTILGENREKRFVVLEWLQGERLIPPDANPADKKSASRIGAALAELHRQSSWRPAFRSRTSEAAHVREVAEFLAFLLPSEAERIGQLAEPLIRTVASFPELSHPVHGDFYGKQVVLGQDWVGIIDLDEAHLGDPAEDMGNFAAHLELDVVRRCLSSETAVGLSGAALEAYASGTGQQMDARVRVYTALKLFELTPHFFRNSDVGWPELTRRCLEHVACLLQVANQGGAYSRGASSRDRLEKAVPVEDPFAIKDDPKFAALLLALDPATAERALAHALDLLDLQLHAIRVIRHKPGRRALVEYTISGCRPGDSTARETVLLVGKIRARGLDRRTVSLMGELREQGFDDASADQISIPEPLGVVPEWHLWLQRRVAGGPVTQWLDGPGGQEACRRAAQAACKLHAASISPDRAHTMEDELAILREGLATVSSERPQLSMRLGNLIEACTQAVQELPPSRACGIHRDFYPDQLLWDGVRLYILDLDLYALGDRHVDAGNFIAHIIEWSWRHLGKPHALIRCEEAFMDGFLEGSPQATPQGVQLCTTLALARHIFLSTRFADRQHLTEPLLALCEARFSDRRGDGPLHS